MLTFSEKKLYLYLALLLLFQSLFALSSPPLVKIVMASDDGSITRFALNNASSEELQRIKGIGVVIAGRIIEHRDKIRGFKTWADVLAVKGIGPKRLELIKKNAYLKKEAIAKKNKPPVNSDQTSKQQ